MRYKMKLILLCVLAVAGIGMLAYPTVSDYVNRCSGSYAISELEQHVMQIEQERISEERKRAEKYNASLPGEEMKAEYADILNISGGIMGSLQIPQISVNLPIYHGTSEEILEKGVGHLESSAFPVGGKGNHCVLTGHTGLPSAKLFTDLTELKEGDNFYIHILEDILAYRVDQIKIVLPSEGEDLISVSGKDYCTLVTCTPYGVNSHRLLVRGERMELQKQEAVEQLNQDIKESRPPVGLLLLAAMILLGGSVLYVFKLHRRKNS